MNSTKKLNKTLKSNQHQNQPTPLHQINLIDKNINQSTEVKIIEVSDNQRSKDNRHQISGNNHLQNSKEIDRYLQLSERELKNLQNQSSITKTAGSSLTNNISPHCKRLERLREANQSLTNQTIIDNVERCIDKGYNLYDNEIVAEIESK